MRNVRPWVPLLLLCTQTPHLLVSLTLPLGPLVLDFGATNHISGNMSLFLSLSTSCLLPSVIMVNGSCALYCGVGIVHLLPFLSLDNLLYVLGCSFNLLSLNHLTQLSSFFYKDFVFLQGQSSRWRIDTTCESHDHGLYILRTYAHAGLMVDSLSVILAKLGHPGLIKL